MARTARRSSTTKKPRVPRKPVNASKQTAKVPARPRPALPGPWEWDVKRLAASFAVAGRERGFDDAARRSVVLTAVREYRNAMRGLAKQRNLDVWYQHLDVSSLADRWVGQASRKARARFERNVAKARTKDSMRAFSKLVREVDGRLRIVSDPPLIVPIEELFPDRADQVEGRLLEVMGAYRATLPDAY